MKDGKTQAQIATLMNRHKSTISRELTRNTGNRGYRPKQACLLAEARSLGSRNAAQITADQWGSNSGLPLRAVEHRANYQSGWY